MKSEARSSSLVATFSGMRQCDCPLWIDCSAAFWGAYTAVERRVAERLDEFLLGPAVEPPEDRA